MYCTFLPKSPLLLPTYHKMRGLVSSQNSANIHSLVPISLQDPAINLYTSVVDFIYFRCLVESALYTLHGMFLFSSCLEDQGIINTWPTSLELLGFSSALVSTSCPKADSWQDTWATTPIPSRLVSHKLYYQINFIAWRVRRLAWSCYWRCKKAIFNHMFPGNQSPDNTECATMCPWTGRRIHMGA